ncbi:hypothetical protein HPB51_006899 [Rhipicephalus microplus]|uniref:Uncharacterized protein n=1 Tax=Rhipicephalus microplus TaxID=6941 RepID=A0A9J6E798_RHIMP|nr:hypothetical protein HPB51_006899 [Rhipicephalus microplus]
MVRLRSASIKSEIFGYASFVDGFSIVGKFHRLLGYSFFSWKNHHGERKYTASVVSPYLAFATLSWSFFAFVMLQDTYRIVFLDVRNGDGKPLRTIDKCILIFYFVRCLGLQLANVSTLVVYSRELDDIVKKMEAIESTFQRPTRLKPAAKFIVLQNVVFSVAALLSIIDEIAEFDGYMQPVHMKTLYGVFSLVFAETVSMIGVSWIMYFSRAFASFLRCINEDIESLAVGRPLARSELAAQHSRFCELWYTFERCDKIFSLGLMIGIPLNIINASPWGYFLLTSHESLLNVSLDVLGFITFGAELFALGANNAVAIHKQFNTAPKGNHHTGSIVRCYYAESLAE